MAHYIWNLGDRGQETWPPAAVENVGQVFDLPATCRRFTVLVRLVCKDPGGSG